MLLFIILYHITLCNYADECPTAVAILPIRGCTVVAERSFTITRKAEVFNWSECGITISAPENSIPDNLGNSQSVVLNVRVTLSGPFRLGASKLMSAVYWLYPNIPCKFTKPLELTVEHCAHLKLPDDHAKLTFLRTKCNQKDLPYKFEEIGGNFTAHSGTVALRSFSGLAVGSKSAESSPPPMKCLARIVTFQTHVTEWNAYCAILKDLNSFRVRIIVVQSVHPGTYKHCIFIIILFLLRKLTAKIKGQAIISLLLCYSNSRRTR